MKSTTRLISIFCLLLQLHLGLAVAQSLPTVERFTLVRADNGVALIDPIINGATIDLKTLPSTKLNIRVITAPQQVKKVEFYLNGKKTFVDSASPYAVFGDDGGNYNSWTPTIGSYVLNAIPYEKETASVGTSRTLSFSVVSVGIAVPTTTPIATPSSTPAYTPTAIPAATRTPPPVATLVYIPTSTPTATPTATPIPSPTVSPTPFVPAGPLPAFPGATGFGSKTVAGSGRHLAVPTNTVHRVTSLGDSGVGSLRACVDATGPRVCIFETSGRIQLKDFLFIKKPYLTIAGQTAPSPGIMLTGAGIRIQTNDVLIQHLQIRVGDGATGPDPGERDGLSFYASATAPVFNVVADHLSVSWAIDENVGSWHPNVSDITISSSIIAEPLYNSIHPKGKHGMGMLVGNDIRRVSLHHNLLAHNHDRNPRLQPGSSMEFVSNVIYNWGGTSGWNVANISDTSQTGVPTQLNFIGNYYKRGPQSPLKASIYASPLASGSRVYVSGNLGPTRTSLSSNEWLISGLPESPYRSLTPTFVSSGIPVMLADESYQNVPTRAGSRPRESNPVDTRIINEVKNGTGKIKDCLVGCTNASGDFPVLAVNQRPLTLPTNYNKDGNSNGYTDLEDWLHSYAASVEN